MPIRATRARRKKSTFKKTGGEKNPIYGLMYNRCMCKKCRVSGRL